MEKNELMNVEERPGFVADLTTATESFCSFVPATPEDKARLFKAMNNPDKKVGECVNLTICVKDIYAEMVTIVNKETGEASQAPRIVLIDTEGVSYQTVSSSMYNGMKKLIQIYGVPTWEDGINIQIKQKAISGGKGWSILTFDVV